MTPSETSAFKLDIKTACKLTGMRSDNVRRSLRSFVRLAQNGQLKVRSPDSRTDELIKSIADLKEPFELDFRQAYLWVHWLDSHATHSVDAVKKFNDAYWPLPPDNYVAFVFEKRGTPGENKAQSEAILPAVELDSEHDGFITIESLSKYLGITSKHLRRAAIQHNVMPPDTVGNVCFSIKEAVMLAIIVPSAVSARLKLFQTLMRAMRNPQTPNIPDFTNPADAARAWADEYDRRSTACVMVQEQAANNMALRFKLKAESEQVTALQRAIASSESNANLLTGAHVHDPLVQGHHEMVYFARDIRNKGFIGLQDMVRRLPVVTIAQRMHELIDKNEVEAPPEATLPRDKSIVPLLVRHVFFQKLTRADGMPVLREAFADESLAFARRVRLPDHAVVARHQRYGMMPANNYAWQLWFRPEAASLVLKNLDKFLKDWVRSGWQKNVVNKLDSEAESLL